MPYIPRKKLNGRTIYSGVIHLQIQIEYIYVNKWSKSLLPSILLNRNDSNSNNCQITTYNELYTTLKIQYNEYNIISTLKSSKLTKKRKEAALGANESINQ